MAPHKKGFMAMTANPLVATTTEKLPQKEKPPRNTMTKIPCYCPKWQTSFCIKPTAKGWAAQKTTLATTTENTID